MESKIYAVDFDGTLCNSEWPHCGEPIRFMVEAVKKLKANGHKIILWTCRSGEALDEAVEWCREQGLIFDSVNENLPEIIEAFGGDCRKIFANYYIDDLGIRLQHSMSGRDDCFSNPINYRALNRYDIFDSRKEQRLI